MKKLWFMVFLLPAVLDLSAQPRAFKYQAVIRDDSGNVLANRNVSIRISIISGSPGGTVEYSENHFTESNRFGLVNLEIGRGTAVLGDFNDIDWGSSDQYLSVAVDETGETTSC